MLSLLSIFFFFFNDTATTEIYTLSLHDALPISAEDLAHYLIAQLDGGRYGEGTVLSAGGMDMVHQPAVRMGSRDRFYGFGWEIGDTNGIPTVSTYGDGPDVHSDLILVPDEGWGVALL